MGEMIQRVAQHFRSASSSTDNNAHDESQGRNQSSHSSPCPSSDLPNGPPADWVNPLPEEDVPSDDGSPAVTVKQVTDKHAPAQKPVCTGKVTTGGSGWSFHKLELLNKIKKNSKNPWTKHWID